MAWFAKYTLGLVVGFAFYEILFIWMQKISYESHMKYQVGCPSIHGIGMLRSQFDHEAAIRAKELTQIQGGFRCKTSTNDCDLKSGWDKYATSVETLRLTYANVSDGYKTGLTMATSLVDNVLLMSVVNGENADVFAVQQPGTPITTKSVGFPRQTPTQLLNHTISLITSLNSMASQATENLTEWQLERVASIIVPKLADVPKTLGPKLQADISKRLGLCELKHGLRFEATKVLVKSVELDHALHSEVGNILRQVKLLTKDLKHFIVLAELLLRDKIGRDNAEFVKMYSKLKNEIAVWLAGGGF